MMVQRFRMFWLILSGSVLCHKFSSMENTLEDQMVSISLARKKKTFTFETKCVSVWSSLKHLFIDWFPETVEAYESGLLAKLLGIETVDHDDLWVGLLMRGNSFATLWFYSVTMNESLHIKDMIRLHFFTAKALIYKM